MKKNKERTMTMKKRAISLVLVLVFAMSLCLSVSAAEVRTVNADITYREISIIINGVEISPCDENGKATEPFIMNSTTYLPVRAIANALGLGVEWVAETSTIALTSGGDVNYGSGEPAATKASKTVDITYRGTRISLDGETVPLVNAGGDTVEPFILNGVNYLPLRIVGEALGLTVSWDGATSTVSMDSGEMPDGYWLPQKQVVTLSVDGYSATETTEYVYTEDGRISQKLVSDTEDGYNSQFYYYYDDGGLKYESYTDSRSNVFNYSYDENGNLTAIYEQYSAENGGGFVQATYTYDELGRLKTEDYWDYYDKYYTEYSYEGDVRFGRVMLLNEAGRPIVDETTTYFFDDMGRPSREEYVFGDDYSSVTEYGYDKYGNINLYKISDSDGYVYSEKWEFDADGKVLSATISDDGFTETTVRTYTESGLPLSTKISRSDGTGESTLYTYDGNGNLVCEEYTDGENRTKNTYSFDEYGRTSRFTQDINGEVGSIDCSYDRYSNLVRAKGQYMGFDISCSISYTFFPW